MRRSAIGPALVLILLVGCGAFTGPTDVIVADPEKAISDAHRLMEEKRHDPTKHQGWIMPAELPPSLQIEGLVYAQVFDDHVNLVLARNPDWQTGGRIWKRGSTRNHLDEPTKYSGITFFAYSNDKPTTPDNLL